MILRFLARHTVIYRPAWVDRFQQTGDGWIACYALGGLRAKIFGVRVPIIWAFQNVVIRP